MARPVCSTCTRPLALCLCAFIPRLTSATEVLLLQHPSESRHALNTGRLAALGLSRAQLWVGETFSELDHWLAASEQPAWLLFPGPGALTSDSAAARAATITRLIVPDGTWRKARLMLYRNPSLALLPRLVLPAGQRSRYRLRKAPFAGALATVEAVAQVLGHLEAPRRFDALLDPFERLIDQQIAAMGEPLYHRHHGKDA